MEPNQAGKKPLLSTCFKLLIFVFMLAAVLANFGFFLPQLAEAAITLDPDNPANINSEGNQLFTPATPQRGVDKAGLRHDTFSTEYRDPSGAVPAGLGGKVSLSRWRIEFTLAARGGAVLLKP